MSLASPTDISSLYDLLKAIKKQKEENTNQYYSVDSFFASIPNSNLITLNIDVNDSYKLIKEKYYLLDTLQKTYPYIFVSKPIEVPQLLKTWMRWKFRFGKISYNRQEKNLIYSINWFYFNQHHLTMALTRYLCQLGGKIIRITDVKTNSNEYIFSYEKINPKFLNAEPVDSTYKWLLENIDTQLSKGEIIDFIDRKYDKIKQTGISATQYHELFKWFGKDIKNIAYTAFDNYISSRDTKKSWQNAIDKYLEKKLTLNNSTRLKIIKLLAD